MKFISIGPYCSSNVMIRKANLRNEAYPFDNIFSSLILIENCINDNFINFLNKDFLTKCSYESSTNLFYEPMIKHDIIINNRIFNKNDPNKIPIFLHHDLTNNDVYDSFVRKCKRFMDIIISNNIELTLVYTINFVSDETIIEKYFNELIDFLIFLGCKKNIKILAIRLLNYGTNLINFIKYKNNVFLYDVSDENNGSELIKLFSNNIIDRNIDINKLNKYDDKNNFIKNILYSKNFNYIVSNFNDDNIVNISDEYKQKYQNESNIECNIHFIWIGSIIKKKYVETIINCKKINKNYDIYLWIDEKSLNEIYINLLNNNNIIIKNYIITFTNDDDFKLINTYINSHPNYGFKADILRYYIVYKYGGIYSDIDSIWLKSFDTNFDKEFVTYRIDNACSNLTNSFFGFCKKSLILNNIIYNLKFSINSFLSNNFNQISNNIPYITGPIFFTRIIIELNFLKLNYIHQTYCVIGGPQEILSGGPLNIIFKKYSELYLSYCYQTFDKNWCV